MIDLNEAADNLESARKATKAAKAASEAAQKAEAKAVADLDAARAQRADEHFAEIKDGFAAALAAERSAAQALAIATALRQEGSADAKAFAKLEDAERFSANLHSRAVAALVQVAASGWPAGTAPAGLATAVKAYVNFLDGPRDRQSALLAFAGCNPAFSTGGIAGALGLSNPFTDIAAPDEAPIQDGIAAAIFGQWPVFEAKRAAARVERERVRTEKMHRSEETALLRSLSEWSVRDRLKWWTVDRDKSEIGRRITKEMLDALPAEPVPHAARVIVHFNPGGTHEREPSCGFVEDLEVS